VSCRRIAVLVALACATLPSVAPQARASLVPEIEVRGGVCLATLTNSDLPDLKYRTGFTGGVGFRLGSPTGWALQPEVNYVVRGAEYKVPIADGLLSAKLEGGYVEIPVLLRANVIGAGPVRLAALLGPSFSIKTSETTKASALFIGTTYDTKLLKSSDVGVTGGASMDFGSGPLRLVADGRATMGLADVNDLGIGGAVHNLDFRLTAGLVFGLMP